MDAGRTTTRLLPLVPTDPPPGGGFLIRTIRLASGVVTSSASIVVGSVTSTFVVVLDGVVVGTSELGEEFPLVKGVEASPSSLGSLSLTRFPPFDGLTLRIVAPGLGVFCDPEGLTRLNGR